MMKFGSSAQVAYGITPAASVSVGDRLAFIKKVYGLLALSLVTAAIGAHLGSDPDLLLIPLSTPSLKKLCKPICCIEIII